MRILNLAKASLSNAYSGDEHSIIQAILSFNELDKTRNLIHEKLEEWYGIFFPELKLANQLTYARFVQEFGKNKREADAQKLEDMLGAAAGQVKTQISNSIGRDPTDEEYEMLNGLAGLELSIAEMQSGLDKYLESSTKRIMPNITYLIDYKVAAELLAKAGSLNKLAFLPAGTVQLLGAEKALFKHIKFGSKPPKYGSIFKLQQISSAERQDRGRIARMYATKIAIAARADGISKNFIADKLKEQLDKSIKQMRPRSKKAIEARKGNFSGNRRWRDRGYRKR